MSGPFRWGTGRVGAAVVGAVLLTAGGLVAANVAQAEQKKPDETQAAREKDPAGKTDPARVPAQKILRAGAIEERVGARAIGSYYNAAGELVVAVSDQATAALVRQAGAIPKLVRYTADELNAIQDELDDVAVGSSAGRVRSWYVDPVSGTVVVTVLRGADDSITDRFLRRARENGAKVTIRSAVGRVVPTADDFSLRGGVQVDKNTGYTCSLGFNAQNEKGNRIFLTAGHCTSGKPSFSRNGYILGNTYSSSFPGNDFGTVGVIEGWDQQGYVEGWGAGNVAVQGVAGPTVGASLCKSGKSTGWTCGRIVARNVTVNYGNNRVVRGLYQHTACVEGGDSGGANMTGNYAQGITSGAALIDGKCLEKSGRTNESYSQPVAEALSATHASLILAN